MGLNFGSLSFSLNQNNPRSSGAYVTCVYYGQSAKANMRKTPHHAQRSWTHLFCICFIVCGRAKNRTPSNWGPLLTTPLGGLGSLVYICGFHLTLTLLLSMTLAIVLVHNSSIFKLDVLLSYGWVKMKWLSLLIRKPYHSLCSVDASSSSSSSLSSSKDSNLLSNSATYR